MSSHESIAFRYEEWRQSQVNVADLEGFNFQVAFEAYRFQTEVLCFKLQIRIRSGLSYPFRPATGMKSSTTEPSSSVHSRMVACATSG
jgi:hypothetical protein